MIPPRPCTILAPETVIERAARELTEHRAACDACIAGILDWCADHGIPKPTTPDLAWVEGR